MFKFAACTSDSVGGEDGSRIDSETKCALFGATVLSKVKPSKASEMEVRKCKKLMDFQNATDKMLCL
jgi:hypothetical protein